MAEQKITESMIRHAWHTYLTTGDMPPSLNPPWFERKFFRPILKRLPKSPRCNICYMPFEGIGGSFSRVFLRAERSLSTRTCAISVSSLPPSITAVWSSRSPCYLWMWAARRPLQKIPPPRSSAS